MSRGPTSGPIFFHNKVPVPGEMIGRDQSLADLEMVEGGDSRGNSTVVLKLAYPSYVYESRRIDRRGRVA
jgi:hypothetical protein